MSCKKFVRLNNFVFKYRFKWLKSVVKYPTNEGPSRSHSSWMGHKQHTHTMSNTTWWESVYKRSSLTNSIIFSVYYVKNHVNNHKELISISWCGIELNFPSIENNKMKCIVHKVWLSSSSSSSSPFSSSVRSYGVRLLSSSTLDPAEIRKFQVLANKWWDIQGEFAPLHAMNELRVPFIRSVRTFCTY